MPAYKDDKSNSWFLRFSYKTWDGKYKKTSKRGFKTKKEALEWEREFLTQKAGSVDMLFSSFVECYLSNVAPRLKETTMLTKRSIIDSSILPYFCEKSIGEITTQDVLQWQNTLLRKVDSNGKQFSKSYLKTLHNQLSAIFNHAVKYYALPNNPAKLVGNMGDEKHVKTEIWTTSEYLEFAEVMMEKPEMYYCFEVLYWCGLRLGEMLALQISDIDFLNKVINVTKTYSKINKKTIVTAPKTPKSIRKVTMPDFLADELKDYISSIYAAEPNDRLFPISKNKVEREMKRGAEAKGLKRIRVHDLRHSHVSMLINLGYTAVAIAERMGHESIDITYRYAHLFPTVQSDMADRLNQIRKE